MLSSISFQAILFFSFFLDYLQVSAKLKLNMTFVHFLNCMALAYAPYVVAYKTSILSEYNALSRVVFAGFIYMVTQLGKMMLLATFFPTMENTGSDFNVMAEFLKTLVDFIDLVGIYFIINRTIGKPELKVLIAGMGWSGAEVVFTNLIPFWVGARGLEFDWKFMRMSLDANITLVHVMAVSALVWAYLRTDLNKNLVPVVTALLAMSVFRNFIVEVISIAAGFSPWVSLLLRAVFTSVIATLSLQLYEGLAKESS
uniref:transmembrane protein 147-like n=1 Tax=Styela clava TaxID=7725 RepID=UPI00193AA9C3|nr:transmembrane protein 147-like [Styela clava]